MKTQDLESRCSSTRVQVPAGFCTKLGDALTALKEHLVADYEALLPGRRHLVHDLIAEAEVLAWETPFPHLFLPDFAELRLAEVLATQQPAFARAA
jgi:hypothetical protein